MQLHDCGGSAAAADDGSGCRESRRRRAERDGQLQGVRDHREFKVGHCKYTLGRPLSRDVFGSSGCQLGCTVAAVSAQWSVKHVKNALQNITTKQTPQIVAHQHSITDSSLEEIVVLNFP